MDKRREDVLEAPYFHVGFTVPQELNPLIYCNQQLLYDVLYHSVSATITNLQRTPIISVHSPSSTTSANIPIELPSVTIESSEWMKITLPTL